MSEQETQAEETQETTEQVESTETQSEETTEATEQTSTEETAETTEESASEESEQTEETETASDDEQFFIRNKVGDEEIVYDIRVPEQRKKLQEDAQKGIGFTKKSQALSEWEKANEPMIQFAQTVLADETMQKALLAKQLNIDPTVAFVQSAPPDEYWKEANPEAYYAALYQHKKSTDDRARLEAGLKQYKEGLATNYNNTLVEKSKVKHDLKDSEVKEVVGYIQENMRANNLGMYSERQFDDAINALYGREKMAKEKLNQSEKFQKTMNKISKSAPVGKTSKAPEPKKYSGEEAEAKRFKDYVKEISKGL